VSYSHLCSNWLGMHHVSLLRRVDYLPYSGFNLEDSTSPFLYPCLRTYPIFYATFRPDPFTSGCVCAPSNPLCAKDVPLHVSFQWTHVRRTYTIPGTLSSLQMTFVAKMLTYSDSHSRGLTGACLDLLRNSVTILHHAMCSLRKDVGSVAVLYIEHRRT
jgi:hypothetical protein